MIRWILQELALFLLPSLLFGAYLLIKGRNPLERVHWDAQAVRLVLAGVFVVVASLVMTGLTATRHQDGFVPTHIENGQVVPGRFQ